MQTGDAGKNVNGIKRHMLTDSNGMILYLKVHPADIQDRDGAKLLLEGLREELPRLATIYADGAYSGELIAWVAETLGCELKIPRLHGGGLFGDRKAPGDLCFSPSAGWWNEPSDGSIFIGG